jgi:hypothetical protein
MVEGGDGFQHGASHGFCCASYIPEPGWKPAVEKRQIAIRIAKHIKGLLHAAARPALPAYGILNIP